MALTDKLTAIGDRIRGLLGTEDLIPLAEMPNEISNVYDSGVNFGNEGGYSNGYNDGREDGIEVGKKSENDRFWDTITQNGTRTDFAYAFSRWTMEHFRPPYKLVPLSNVNYAFYACGQLERMEKAYFDCTQLQPNQTYSYTWSVCKNLKVFEDVGLPAAGKYNATWYECVSIKTIEAVRSVAETQYYYTFGGCWYLENLTIDGVIGQNGFSVSDCTWLTHDSLMSIINALKTFTDGTTKTVTLGATNIAKLTDAEKAIATQKGWTLA